MNYTHVMLLRNYTEYLTEKEKRRNIKPVTLKAGNVYKIKDMDNDLITIHTEYGLCTIANDAEVQLIEGSICFFMV